MNYRSKAPRAEKVVAEITAAGGRAIAIGADLTDPASVAGMFERTRAELGPIDILVLNASGGMESGMGEDYAMRLNRDAQVNVLEGALPHLAPGARIVFVTSHQAHFIRTTPTMPEYEPVALSKRAGEDALRAKLPELEAAGFEFVVVSGDMIEGTITATLLERANPGAIEARKQDAGPALQRVGVRRRGRIRRGRPGAGRQHPLRRRHVGVRRRELTAPRRASAGMAKAGREAHDAPRPAFVVGCRGATPRRACRSRPGRT